MMDFNFVPRNGSAHANQWQRNSYTLAGSKYQVRVKTLTPTMHTVFQNLNPPPKGESLLLLCI